MHTPQTFAALLDRREYPRSGLLSTQEQAAAEAAGLVVAYGMSDDLLEFEGAMRDEFGAYDGTTVRFSRAGFVHNECDQDDDCPNFKALRNAQPAVITAKWANDCPTWTIDTNFPVERFSIVENGDPFSVGVVFRLADVPELGDSPELVAAKAELARWRDATQHWIVRDGELVNFVLGNAFTTDEPYPGTQSEPLLEHIQNLRRHAEALEVDLAAARAERDRLQQQLAENNAVLSRRIGA